MRRTAFIIFCLTWVSLNKVFLEALYVEANLISHNVTKNETNSREETVNKFSDTLQYSIVNGHQAKIRHFFVRVSRVGHPNIFCGGACIGALWVITAATCVLGAEGNSNYCTAVVDNSKTFWVREFEIQCSQNSKFIEFFQFLHFQLSHKD